MRVLRYQNSLNSPKDLKEIVALEGWIPDDSALK